MCRVAYMLCFVSILRFYPSSSRALLISPLQERPGFSLASIHFTDAEEGFLELRPNGVLGSSRRKKLSEVRSECRWSPVFLHLYRDYLGLWNYESTAVFFVIFFGYIVEEDDLLGGANEFYPGFSHLSCGWA